MMLIAVKSFLFCRHVVVTSQLVGRSQLPTVTTGLNCGHSICAEWRIRRNPVGCEVVLTAASKVGARGGLILHVEGVD